MTFVSAHFGPLTVTESGALVFPEGLPGFEDQHRFVPLHDPARPALVFLQSLDRPDLCFPALPVRTVRPDYELALSAEDRELLGFVRQPAIGKDAVALALVSLVEGRDPTVNLLGPIVIHMRTRRAVQAIRPDGRYGCSEPLVPEAEAARHLEAVCS